MVKGEAKDRKAFPFETGSLSQSFDLKKAIKTKKKKAQMRERN